MHIQGCLFLVDLREVWIDLRGSHYDKLGRIRNMARPGNTLHIPLSEKEALSGLLKVKPTEDMPRPGANPIERKKRKGTKRKKTTAS
jgi:hypothetical protein